MQVERKAYFGKWKVADGWVTRGNLPFSTEQQLETTANTVYALRGKDLSVKDGAALD